MDSTQLINAVLEEVQRIPVERLPEVYHLIHAFRLKTESKTDNSEMMRFAGCWSDLPDETYNDLIEEIETRRQQAFSGRQAREANLD
jgi:hypothetical protein